jgi:hypothetical protein
MLNIIWLFLQKYIIWNNVNGNRWPLGKIVAGSDGPKL